MATELVPIERPRDPLDFLARAQEGKAPPEEIEKWITLYERVTKAQAEQAYAEAMRRCQEKMPVILKTAENKHTRSKYPLFENVLAIIKPIYVAEGFALSFGTDDSILAGHYRIYCDVKHVGGHSERYHGDFPADGKGAKGGDTSMNAIQAIGSMYTYARRYLMVMIFGLTVAGEDTDAAQLQFADDAELKKQADLLLEIRERYVEADLTDDEADKFWTWVSVGTGDFNDIPAAKYRDIAAMLKRKLAQKKKGVTA